MPAFMPSPLNVQIEQGEAGRFPLIERYFLYVV